MMPKLFIIDPSIQSVGGHYYSYADALREPSQELGYDFVIVGNRKLSAVDRPKGVLPLFDHTFWDGHASGARDFWANAHGVFRSKLGKWAMTAHYSDVGFERPIRGGPLTRSAVFASRTPARLLLSLSYRASSSHKWGTRIGQIRQQLLKRRVVTDLNAGLASLFETYDIGADDTIFLPTCSENELAGVILFASKHSARRAPHWKLLFRRPVDEGLRAAFHEHRHAIAGWPTLEFLTDTRELSITHERTTGQSFRTLPIPHTAPPRAEPPLTAEFTAIYVGDARTEKGYGALPEVVSQTLALAPPPRMSDHSIGFVFQSNFNVPEGEPIVAVAKSRLSLEFSSASVTLVDGPLDGTRYWDLLRSGGVNLLLYDSLQYRDRSSGILAESLGAGLPCIVSSGSWLDRQVRNPVRSHQNAIAGACDTVGSEQLTPSRAMMRDADVAWVKGQTIFLRNRITYTCRMNKGGSPADFVQISASFTAAGAGPRIGVRLAFFDRYWLPIRTAYRTIDLAYETDLFELLRVPQGAARFEVAFSEIPTDAVVTMTKGELRWLLDKELRGDRPISAAAVIVGSQGEAAEAILEVYRYRAAYVKSARDFSAQWLNAHNPHTTVAQLLHG